MELRAEYLLRLSKREESQAAYRALIERNNEYRIYYEGLERAMGYDRSTQKKELQDLYTAYAEQSDRLDAARRIPLDFLEGDEFRTAADQYLRRMLNKGIPSTFANIKALYQDTSKRSVVQELALSYLSEASANGSADKQTNGHATDHFKPSLYYFLAQHFNYHLTRDLEKAMEYIGQAFETNPQSVDYMMTKARILKHYGNLAKASETMNQARELDEKDRYINTKCAKYQLRNDQNEDAIKTMSKFTRNETVGGPLGDLHDMQCMWFITEDGEANLRQNKLGLALKRFKAIHDIFETWIEDQFDFHSFSFRKGQVRAYVDMLRWEDRLLEHPFYARAALSAINIYITLYDQPYLAHGLSDDVRAKFDTMNADDKKKAIKKAKKDQEKADAEEAKRKEEEKKASAAKKATTGGDGEPKKEDPDPKGMKLLATEKPLEDAMKFLNPLMEFRQGSMEAQSAGFEVYIRRSAYHIRMSMAYSH